MENNQTPLVSFNRLDVTRLISDSITVSWDFEVEGGSEDNVRFVVAVKGKLADGSSWRRVGASERRSCTITGLKPDTKYSFYIVAVYGDEDIAQYPDTDEGLVLNTPVKDVEAPNVSSNELTASAITENGFTLIWTKANDNVTAKEDIVYQVFYIEKDNPAASWKATEAAKGIGSFQFDDLKMGTDYLVYVEAKDKAGNLLRYPSKTKEGFLQVKTKGIIANVMGRYVTNRTENSITIRWDKAAESDEKERGLKYDLTLEERKGNAGQFATDVKGYSYTFSGLKPQTDYSIVIKTTDKNGNSADYSSVSQSTLAEKKPSAKQTGFQITSDSITAVWGLDDHKFYEAGIMEKDSARPLWQIIRQPSLSNFTFTGLKPDTEYKLYVLASDVDRDSDPYSPDKICAVVKTSPAPVKPPKPVNEQGTTVTTNKTLMSRYFKLEQFLDSETALKSRVKNLPSWEIVKNLNEFAQFLDGLREAWGGPISILSGFRSSELNKVVEGVTRTAHKLGFAADLVPANGNLEGFKKTVREWIKNKKYDQCLVEKNGHSAWIHIGLYSPAGEQRCEIGKEIG